MKPIYLCHTCSMKRQRTVVLPKLRAVMHVLMLHHVKAIDRLLAYTIRLI